MKKCWVDGGFPSGIVVIEETTLQQCGGTYYQAHGSQYVVCYVDCDRYFIRFKFHLASQIDPVVGKGDM